MKSNDDIAKVVKQLSLVATELDTDFGKVIAFEAPIVLNDAPEKKRRQKVMARIGQNKDFGETVEVVSIIGDLDKSDVNKALETTLSLLMLNQRMIFAKTQIDQKGKKMLIGAKTLAASCSEKELKSMIQEVTIWADFVERQLLGVDKT